MSSIRDRDIYKLDSLKIKRIKTNDKDYIKIESKCRLNIIRWDNIDLIDIRSYDITNGFDFNRKTITRLTFDQGRNYWAICTYGNNVNKLNKTIESLFN